MAHFKFTFDLKRRTEQALERRSHSRGGRKYFHYQLLLQTMRRRGSNFTAAESASYSSPGALAAHGLLVGSSTSVSVDRLPIFTRPATTMRLRSLGRR